MSWRDLLEYWRSKHVGGRPPSRACLDPVSEIPRLVRNLILIDRLADGFRYRLVGSELVARVGRDATGEGAGQGRHDAALIERWVATLDEVARRCEPRLVRSYLAGGGSLLTLVLPLVSADGATEMLLGGSFTENAGEGSWRPDTLERVDMAEISDHLATVRRSPTVGRVSPP